MRVTVHIMVICNLNNLTYNIVKMVCVCVYVCMKVLKVKAQLQCK